MSESNDNARRASHIERIRALVRDDHERMSKATSPYAVFGLVDNASYDEVDARYKHYERFYRLENFQRLDDIELTQQAFDIRRIIDRSRRAIQVISLAPKARTNTSDGEPEHAVSGKSELSPDARAMGDIYYRDGLTYLHLTDYHAAEQVLQRALEYDPSRGIIVAHLGYTRFKLRRSDSTVVKEVKEMLASASELEPANPEIYMLMARFGHHTKDIELVSHAIAQIEAVAPAYPKLEKLRKYVGLPRNE